MLDLMPWILIVQLWTDPPPQIKFIYKKEYSDYKECMTARRDWDNKGFVAICAVKPVDNPDKKL